MFVSVTCLPTAHRLDDSDLLRSLGISAVTQKDQLLCTCAVTSFCQAKLSTPDEQGGFGCMEHLVEEVLAFSWHSVSE